MADDKTSQADSSASGAVGAAKDPTPTTLETILAELQTVAGEVLAKIEDGAKEVWDEVEPVIETTFVQVLKEWGQLGIQTVTDLMHGADTKDLTGSEKQNLAATTIVDSLAQKGVTLATPHVSALIEFSLTAVKAEISKLLGE